jgi:HD-GYP domain-containing protein (c-di-GMP phosphodiesterase class II)
VKTKLRTRAFLLCFLPFAILLCGGFWIVQRFVDSTVRDGLRTELRERQAVIAAAHGRAALQNSHFLKIAGENTALKAGIALLRAHPGSENARRTVEDQLRELGERMGVDLMAVSTPDGNLAAGVLRRTGLAPNRELVPVPLPTVNIGSAGLLLLDGQLLQAGSVPVDEDEENIARLTVGDFFDLEHLPTPAVLVHSTKAIGSNIPGLRLEELDRARVACTAGSECDLHFAGRNWISLPIDTYGDGYTLLSLEDVDAATKPIEARLNQVFAILALLCVAVALFCSMASSNSIAKPIAAIVAHLHNGVGTGTLPELQLQSRSSVAEIQELSEIYSRAATSVRDSGHRLTAAYLEFVESLASALDARDCNTAGHSRRVSELSCALAAALGLSPDDVARIRIGALLHDIGKIGIADAVLQKPGRLTSEEFALVKQHPVIGRRILAGVGGFAPYLGAVELHHENWDGTGYPRGQRGEETPIDARIIHVADSYDAMTTDRSYRLGMCDQDAVAELERNAGTQFDPRIVEAFVDIPRQTAARRAAADRAMNLRTEVMAG